MDLKTQVRLPQQKDRRAELQALSELLSAQADLRQARPGDEPFEIDQEQLRTRSREIRRQWRKRRIVVAGLLLMAAVTVGALVLSALNPPAAGRPAAPAGTVTTTAGSPASVLGAQAHARLTRGGRPVTAFGCVGAYLADAPQSGGVLPTPGGGTSPYDEYMKACLSDISGATGPRVG